MLRASFDANVLFAAALSSTGASRAIINCAVGDRFQPLASALVLEEAKRNLEQKAPDAVPAYRQLISAIQFEMVEPSDESVQAAAKYTTLKDAPVFAGAQTGQADYLVSLDRRHLVENEAVRRHAGLPIVLPEEFLTILRAQ